MAAVDCGILAPETKLRDTLDSDALPVARGRQDRQQQDVGCYGACRGLRRAPLLYHGPRK